MKKWMVKKKIFHSVLFIGTFLISPFGHAGAILYVGTHWPGTQYATIQAAIDAATDSDEIWVEKGTYTLTSTIAVSKAISLYGGFSGSETVREQRDWVTNVTTVDGNNSVYCFLVTNTVAIDGFTIAKGENDATVNNGGGGIANGVQSGAAGYLTVANCIFTLNNSQKHGGAILNDSGDITVTHCTFTNNTAINRGGAINHNYGATMNVTDCSFSENSAGSGGAIYIRSSTTDQSIITDSTFSLNQATSDDGGSIIADQNVTITRCSFDRNSAVRYGTFTTRGDKSAVFMNCIFSKNSVLYGGAICINGTSTVGTVTTVNCTFTGNTLGSGGKGGVIYTMAPGGGSSVFTLTNCILWGNGGNQVDRSGTTQLLPTVSYTDIDQDGYAGSNGNIRQDPLFVDPINIDFHLQANSPCIDAGTSDGTPTTDMEGNPRYDDPLVPNTGGGAYPYYDMGVYEHQLKMYSISGRITGDVLEGVTITLSGTASYTTITNASGEYSFTGLSNGTYTVTPSLSGYTFTPPEQSIEIAGSDVIGVDFIASENLPDLSGTWSPVTKQFSDGKYLYKAKLGIANTGQAGANNVKVNIYLSKDTILNQHDKLAYSTTIPSINPGATKIISIKKILSINLIGKYLIGLIDPDNTIKESNENNNIAVSNPIP